MFLASFSTQKSGTQVMQNTSKLLIGLLGLLPAVAFADHTTIGLQGNVTGPSTTSSANPMDAGKMGFTLQFQQLNFDAISDADFEHAAENDEDVHGTDSITNTGFAFTYGMSDRLTLGFSIANIRRSGLVEAAHHDDEGEAGPHAEEEEIIEHLGSASGLGDARLYASYQLFSGASSSTSVLFGIKAPTGETGEVSNDGERLEAEFQPGSGSWDTLLGLAFTQQLSSWTINSNVLYTFASEGSQDTDLGDVFNYNLAASHALPKFGPFNESPWNLDFVFEVNGGWRDNVKIAGESERHSGGNIIYFAPGLSLSNDKIFINASISKAVDNLNGIQSEPETRDQVRG